MSLTPAKHDFGIWKGATFRKNFILKIGDDTSPVRDLTDYTARCRIFNPQTNATLLDMTTGNNQVIIDELAGKITLLLTDIETEALTWQGGNYTLTITAPSGGDTDAILHGIIRVQGP